MDHSEEIAELRREIEQQRAMVNAAHGACISILDLLIQALADGGAVDRAELAKALVEAVAKAEDDPDATSPAQVLGRNLLRAFINNLPPPRPPSTPKRKLRVV